MFKPNMTMLCRLMRVMLRSQTRSLDWLFGSQLILGCGLSCYNTTGAQAWQASDAVATIYRLALPSRHCSISAGALLDYNSAAACLCVNCISEQLQYRQHSCKGLPHNSRPCLQQLRSAKDSALSMSPAPECLC